MNTINKNNTLTFHDKVDAAKISGQFLCLPRSTMLCLGATRDNESTITLKWPQCVCRKSLCSVCVKPHKEIESQL